MTLVREIVKDAAIGVDQFNHRDAGFAIDAALGPKDANVGGDRHTGLLQLRIKRRRSNLVGGLDPRSHAGALRIDDQLSARDFARFDIGQHALDRRPAFAAIHRHTSDP